MLYCSLYELIPKLHIYKKKKQKKTQPYIFLIAELRCVFLQAAGIEKLPDY